jgi:hypothetical protein
MAWSAIGAAGARVVRYYFRPEEFAMKKLLLVIVLSLVVPVTAAEKAKKQEPAAFKNASSIVVTLVSLSLESYGPMKPDRTFKQRESVFINLQVRGLTPNKEKKYAVQADILVPQLDQDQKKILDTSINADEVVSLYFQIPLPEVEKGGPCDVVITLRDMTARKYVQLHTWFMIAK